MRKINSYIIEKLKLNKDAKSDISKEANILIDFVHKDYPDMADALKKYIEENDFYDFITYIGPNYGDEHVYDKIKKELNVIEDSNNCNMLFDKIDAIHDIAYYKKSGTAHIENLYIHDNIIGIWASKTYNTPRLNIFLVKNE